MNKHGFVLRKHPAKKVFLYVASVAKPIGFLFVIGKHGNWPGSSHLGLAVWLDFMANFLPIYVMYTAASRYTRDRGAIVSSFVRRIERELAGSKRTIDLRRDMLFEDLLLGGLQIDKR